MPSNELWAFRELASGTHCFLAFEPNGKPVIKHPKCQEMADVIAELDAFYCMKCRYSGRISGAWVREIADARR